MSKRTLTTLLLATFLCLAPSLAWANGWDRVETCFKTSLSGAVIGCVVGLIVALCRRVSGRGVFGWTIGAGLGLGMGGALLFFPSDAGIGLVILISVVLLAGGGGGLLAALAAGMRSSLRPSDDNDKAPRPDKTENRI